MCEIRESHTDTGNVYIVYFFNELLLTFLFHGEFLPSISQKNEIIYDWTDKGTEISWYTKDWRFGYGLVGFCDKIGERCKIMKENFAIEVSGFQFFLLNNVKETKSILQIL